MSEIRLRHLFFKIYIIIEIRNLTIVDLKTGIFLKNNLTWLLGMIWKIIFCNMKKIGKKNYILSYMITTFRAFASSVRELKSHPEIFLFFIFFAIPSSSRHEIWMLVRFFWLFQCSTIPKFMDYAQRTSDLLDKQKVHVVRETYTWPFGCHTVHCKCVICQERCFLSVLGGIQ